MNVKVKQKDKIVAIFLDGVLNYSNMNLLVDIIEGFGEKLPDINYIDCNDLLHIDSLAIGYLIRTFSKFKKYGSELILTNLNEKIAKIFKLTKIDKFFTIQQNFNYDNIFSI